MATGTDLEIGWLQSLSRFGIRPGLERTKRVLQALGHPEDRLRFLHVAGTNGKGSVCSFLTHALSTRNRVGTFTSPAFDGYRGRFVVAGETISDTAFRRLAGTVMRTVQEVTADDPLTEFEALTVMAILYFAEQQVDVVVWETGLGGRYDSTNVVRPLVSAITNVGLDHTDILGSTVQEIARDKAGIIKPGVPIVTAATGPALDVIVRVARQAQAPCYVRGIHFAGTRIRSAGGEYLNYRGLYADLGGVQIGLRGPYQVENAAVALAVTELAMRSGAVARLSAADIRTGLGAAVWPGRFEICRYDGVPVILDGAHNPDGAAQLAEALRDYSKQNGFAVGDWTLVVGMLADKDTRTMLRRMLPYATRVVVTAPNQARAKNPVELANDIIGCRRDLAVEIVASVPEAIRAAVAYGRPVCCWGSLYTVHEARQAMKQSVEQKQGR